MAGCSSISLLVGKHSASYVYPRARAQAYGSIHSFCNVLYVLLKFHIFDTSQLSSSLPLPTSSTLPLPSSSNPLPSSSNPLLSISLFGIQQKIAGSSVRAKPSMYAVTEIATACQHQWESEQVAFPSRQCARTTMRWLRVKMFHAMTIRVCMYPYPRVFLKNSSTYMLVPHHG